MVIKVRKSGVKSGAFPNPSTQFTKENAAYYGAKGGRKGRIAKSLAKRKKCSPKCPIYDRYIFVGVGRKTGVCPLSNFSKGFMERFIAIMMGNEYEMREAIRIALVDLFAHIMIKKYDDPMEEIEEKRRLLYDMIRVKKVLWG
jgi:hypothetical protein